MTDYTCSLSWLATLVKVLPLYNIDPYEFLDSFGIRKSMFQAPDTRISLRITTKIFETLARMEKTSTLGLTMAKFTEPAALGALGIASMCSTSLLDAFKRLEQFQTTLTDITNFEVCLDDGRCTLSISTKASHAGSFYSLDWSLATLIRFARIRLGKHINPLAIYVGRSVNQEVADTFNKIARCEVTFNSDGYALCFARSVAEEPLLIVQQHILDDAVLELKRKQKSVSRNESDFLTRFQSSLTSRLPCGAPSLKSIASDLQQSERSLQRHLLREGKSFRNLLNELRRELAIDYLDKQSMPITEISGLLGFSSSSSFSRWFRGIFGDSPQNYQRH